MDRKGRIWNILVRGLYLRYVPVFGSVVDLGAGNGEFINAIQAEHRIAVDLNPQTENFLEPGVEFVNSSSLDLAVLEDHSINTVFTSSFFENLPSPDGFFDTLRKCLHYSKSHGDSGIHGSQYKIC